MIEFQVRLNCIDHYQAQPTSFEPSLGHRIGKHGSQTDPRVRVPVIRVFGSTPTGQKVCVHVHGMFPYIYVQYDGDLSPAPVAEYLHRLQLSIDHALAVSYRRNDEGNPFVVHISLVKGVPFYGYYVGYRFFAKVYLYNPMYVTRLADLLRQGAVMHTAMQPYESHMQFIPQWMCDYNLFGCDYMRCGIVKFRSPVPSRDDAQFIPNGWHDESIPQGMISNADHMPRQSHCELEVDVCVQDILDRSQVKPRALHNAFDETANSPPVGEKLVASMAGLWRDETRRRKARMGLIDEDETPFPSDVLLSVSADPRDSKDGGWIHEAEYRRKIRELVEAEQRMVNDQVKFSTFLRNDSHEDMIQTALESVEDMYPGKREQTMAARRMTRDQAGLSGQPIEDMLDVDEDRALALVDGPADAHTGDGFEPRLKEGPPDSGDLPTDEPDQMIGPGSSLGLDELGVRDAGDYAYVVEDAFEIPQQWVGDENMIVPPEKRQHSPDHHSRKRQKLVQSVARPEPTDSSIDGAVGVNSQDLHEAPKSAPERPASLGAKHDSNNPNRIHLLGSVAVSPVKSRSAIAETKEREPSLSFPSLQSTKPTASPSANGRSGSSANEKDPMSLDRLVANLGSTSKESVYAGLPPTSDDVMLDLQQSGLGSVTYQDAYYNEDKDVPDGGREYAGRSFKIPGGSLKYMPEFDAHMNAFTASMRTATLKHDDITSFKIWEISSRPPTSADVIAWMDSGAKVLQEPQPSLSQVEAPTQKHRGSLKHSQRKRSANVMTEAQYMSLLSLEVHVNTRGDLLPDPRHDEIQAIFWCLQHDSGGNDAEDFAQKTSTGVLVLSSDPFMAAQFRKQDFEQLDEEDNELDLLTKLVDVVRDLDPDIITGFEVHNSSWGYLIERARFNFDYGLCDELSKVKSSAHGHFGKEADRWGFDHTSTIRVTGRHTINIWRAMRLELTLLQYTLENVAFNVLNRRVPHYAYTDLTRWYKSGNPRDIHKVIEYWKSRTILDLEILDRNELVARVSEQARLLGVDFYAVFARGSQFKVESLMFRIAKPESFLLASPSRKQVGQQNALECLPLVMEPQSDFYTSPVLVLDFQSLYPSVMIAYNYCYSTYMGRVTPWRGRNKMGFTDFYREPRLLELLEEHVNIAPNGIMYVRPEIRKSLLAKMLGEILETRVMVKSGMKADKNDQQLQRLLNHRQLALKLIANVTYGYTSASFSGRMPCSEIADSIVQTGRETLERAIALIHSVRRWGAEVVYGDTDSLFVHLKGRTRNEAFDIGEEIAKTITDMNPRPVKLKFEKVYHPCVLLAKKRYVGFKYETRDQVEPEFDAKGIETVRRDGTPAEQKIEEVALKTLFRTADLSQVKAYFQRQCAKIMQGHVSIQDFCFAREVRLGHYSEKGPAPPGALVSARKMIADPRAEPQYGERVPYVVVAGAPGARLIDRCFAPEAVLRDDQIELDADYYILKNIIPPLERIFNLVGANVRQWYDEMPKLQRVRRIRPANAGGGAAAGKTVARRTLESYMRVRTCLACNARLTSDRALCRSCRAQPAQALFGVRAAARRDEARLRDVLRVCRSCAGLAFGDDVRCDSRDCPVFYSRVRYEAHVASRRGVHEEAAGLLEKIKPRKLEW